MRRRHEINYPILNFDEHFAHALKLFMSTSRTSKQRISCTSIFRYLCIVMFFNSRKERRYLFILCFNTATSTWLPKNLCCICITLNTVIHCNPVRIDVWWVASYDWLAVFCHETLLLGAWVLILRVLACIEAHYYYYYYYYYYYIWIWLLFY
jgi:hypothetical protein